MIIFTKKFVSFNFVSNRLRLFYKLKIYFIWNLSENVLVIFIKKKYLNVFKNDL